MKKLLILVDKIGPKKEMFAQLLSQRLGDNVQIVLGKFSNVTIEIDTNDVEAFIDDFNFRDFDLVYFRRIDHNLFPLSGTLAMCLDKFGIEYFDTRFREIGSGGDKFTSLTKLALSGVPVPKTIFAPRELILENQEKIIAKLGLPILVKDTQSQHNTGIYLVRKKEDIGEILKLNKQRKSGMPIQFLLQEFIDIDKEYRLLVLKDRVAVAHYKDKRKYDNLVVKYEYPNLETEFVNMDNLPDNLKEAAVKAARALGVEIAGVDACITKRGDVIVLEVNRGPGFEYDVKKSPEIDEIAKFFKKELGNA